jgi:hypothetical protein
MDNIKRILSHKSRAAKDNVNSAESGATEDYQRIRTLGS